MTYAEALTDAMHWLAAKPDTLFLGQAVACDGTGMSASFKGIDPDRLIELPVFENTQLGMSLGLALAGYVPVSVFPRWNFLMAAMDQLVNHLDKIPLISEYRPKVIIRTAVGSVHPLDPQWQHKGDFSDPVKQMLKTVRLERVETPSQVVLAYQHAYHRKYSTIVVEISDLKH